MKNAKVTGKQRQLGLRIHDDARKPGHPADRVDQLSMRRRRPSRVRGSLEEASAELDLADRDGQTEPSINTLFAIVSELELSVNEIVFDAKQDAGLPSVAAALGPNGEVAGGRADEAGPAEAADSPVQRSTNRTSISLESGVSWQRLGPARSQRRLPLPPLSAGRSRLLHIP
jgi:hypothetical protein